MVPVLSMQTVSTWLMDSTELEFCRRTPESAMRTAAIMYVRVIRRNRAIGTMSSTMTACLSESTTSMFLNMLSTTSKARKMNARIISISVTALVSTWRGVFFFSNFFALLSILEEKVSSPTLLTMNQHSPDMQYDPEYTVSPSCFLLVLDSPVRRDSSISSILSSTIMPSTCA